MAGYVFSNCIYSPFVQIQSGAVRNRRLTKHQGNRRNLSDKERKNRDRWNVPRHFTFKRERQRINNRLVVAAAAQPPRSRTRRNLTTSDFQIAEKFPHARLHNTMSVWKQAGE